MSFARYSTPTLTFTLNKQNLDLQTMDSVWVTFSSAGIKFDKTGEDLVIGEKTVGVYLSQEETAKFGNTVEVQVNWTRSNGYRGNSVAAELPVDKNLLERVLE